MLLFLWKRILGHGFLWIVQLEVESLPAGNILKRLDERTKISLKDYETLHEKRRSKNILDPAEEFALIGVDGCGYRKYDFINFIN